MSEYEVNNSCKLSQIIKNTIVLGSLLFSACALNVFPWGNTDRYLTYILVPLTLIYLMLFRHSVDWRSYGNSLFYCIAPFIPFLLVYAFVRIYHGIVLTNDGTYIYRLLIIIIASGLVFGVLCQNKRISQQLFFGCCAIFSIACFVDTVYTAYIHGVSVWGVKRFVLPYATTYSRCLAVVSGLSLLGFFRLPNPEKKLRFFCLVASVFGFCAAIGFVGIRAVALIPFFALIVGYFFSPLKVSTKVLTVSFISVLIATAIAISPFFTRVQTAYNEVSNVVSNNAVEIALANIGRKDLSPQEVKMQKYLNTSVGARLAVWGIAKKALDNHLLLGTGKGSPDSFVNTRELFKFSHDYLKHFHSDYIQVTVVGGLLLLGAFVLTQLWLICRSIKNPLTLFMTLSMISYGLFDYGFFDRKFLTCYLGASIIIWSWQCAENHSVNEGRKTSE